MEPLCSVEDPEHTQTAQLQAAIDSQKVVLENIGNSVKRQKETLDMMGAEEAFTLKAKSISQGLGDFTLEVISCTGKIGDALRDLRRGIEFFELLKVQASVDQPDSKKIVFLANKAYEFLSKGKVDGPLKESLAQTHKKGLGLCDRAQVFAGELQAFADDWEKEHKAKLARELEEAQEQARKAEGDAERAAKKVAELEKRSYEHNIAGILCLALLEWCRYLLWALGLQQLPLVSQVVRRLHQSCFWEPMQPLGVLAWCLLALPLAFIWQRDCKAQRMQTLRRRDWRRRDLHRGKLRLSG